MWLVSKDTSFQIRGIKVEIAALDGSIVSDLCGSVFTGSSLHCRFQRSATSMMNSQFVGTFGKVGVIGVFPA